MNAMMSGNRITLAREYATTKLAGTIANALLDKRLMMTMHMRMFATQHSLLKQGLPLVQIHAQFLFFFSASAQFHISIFPQYYPSVLFGM
jgi:hypothetical protein